MDVLLTDDLSLWDSVEGSTAHDYLGLDYGSLHNDCKTKENLTAEPIHVDERVEQPLAEDEERLLLDELDHLVDESAFATWMEDKFDFDECNMTFNSLEDVEMLLKDNEYEQIEKSEQSFSAENSPSSFSEENSTPPYSEENSITEEEENHASQETAGVLPVVELNFGHNCEQQIVIDLVVAGANNSPGSGAEAKRERVKPYSRSKPVKRKATTVENKKSRKRNQNRDAATRYRVKKKEESDALSEEEDRLTAVNEELSKKAESLSTEISYLKALMKELIQAKKN